MELWRRSAFWVIWARANRMTIDRDQCSFMMVGESEWDWQIVLPLLNTGHGLFKHKVIHKEWKKREGTRHICMISQRALSVDILGCCSVVKSCLTLQRHGLQHARLPCPSLSPRIFSSSCSWSRWCHPTIPFSVIPFSTCPQSFPASGFFPVSWPFTSGDQSIGALASVSVLPMNIQGWYIGSFLNI